MNNKMIVYIIAKMLGVEGAVLLIPAFVAFLYGESDVIQFLIVSAVLGAIFFIFRKKKTGKQSYLRERGTCDCRACLDSLVFIWSAAICADRKHSKLCGCIF